MTGLKSLVSLLTISAALAIVQVSHAELADKQNCESSPKASEFVYDGCQDSLKDQHQHPKPTEKSFKAQLATSTNVSGTSTTCASELERQVEEAPGESAAQSKETISTQTELKQEPIRVRVRLDPKTGQLLGIEDLPPMLIKTSESASGLEIGESVAQNPPVALPVEPIKSQEKISEEDSEKGTPAEKAPVEKAIEEKVADEKTAPAEKQQSSKPHKKVKADKKRSKRDAKGKSGKSKSSSKKHQQQSQKKQKGKSKK